MSYILLAHDTTLKIFSLRNSFDTLDTQRELAFLGAKETNQVSILSP